MQGYLTDADGVPVDGDHRVTFTIYDADAGGTAVFTDDRTVTVRAGHFTVYLGDGDTPLDLSLFQANGDLWLETVLDGREIVQPRVPLGSVPYAAMAAYAGEADYAAVCGSMDWSSLQSVPAGLSDGDQGFTTEGELTTLLDDNYVAASGGTADGLTTTGALTTATVRVSQNQDVDVGVNGAVVIGATDGGNMGLDSNEIMARNNGNVSALHLNAEGGTVQIGGNGTAAANLAELQIDVDAAERPSGSDATPEVYSLTGTNGCRRGSMFVGRPSGAPNQDALCVCLDNNGTRTYWCFNP